MTKFLNMPFIVAFGLLCFMAFISIGTTLRSNRSNKNDILIPFPTNFVAPSLLAVNLGLFCFLRRSIYLYVPTLLIFLSVLGTTILKMRIKNLLKIILNKYMNPLSWWDVKAWGANWRYPMKFKFRRAPEYVDELITIMIRETDNYEEFKKRILSSKFPLKFKELLHRRYWGFLLPSLKKLMQVYVVSQVFENDGPFSPNKTSSQIFQELKRLSLSGDSNLLLNRLQYYWGLRSLNMINNLLHNFLSSFSEIVIIIVPAIIYLFYNNRFSFLSFLLAISFGSIIWSLVVSGGLSLMISKLFRGTGTFSISYPLKDNRYDPLWSRFVEIGILAFSISFLTYGIGLPILFSIGSINKTMLNWTTVSLSVMSISMCLYIFINHLRGTHIMMKESKESKLSDIENILTQELDNSKKNFYITMFKDISLLREWPMSPKVFAQIVAGFILPITVQVVIIYFGLASP